MLALRVWIEDGAYGVSMRLRALSLGRASREARDIALRRAARKVKRPEVIWDESGDLYEPEQEFAPEAKPAPRPPLQAAE